MEAPNLTPLLNIGMACCYNCHILYGPDMWSVACNQQGVIKSDCEEFIDEYVMDWLVLLPQYDALVFWLIVVLHIFGRVFSSLTEMPAIQWEIFSVFCK